MGDEEKEGSTNSKYVYRIAVVRSFLFWICMKWRMSDRFLFLLLADGLAVR
jgi:hypothetical protein